LKDERHREVFRELTNAPPTQPATPATTNEAMINLEQHKSTGRHTSGGFLRLKGDWGIAPLRVREGKGDEIEYRKQS